MKEEKVYFNIIRNGVVVVFQTPKIDIAKERHLECSQLFPEWAYSISKITETITRTEEDITPKEL